MGKSKKSLKKTVKKLTGEVRELRDSLERVIQILAAQAGQPSPGEGTTFWFKLPFKVQEPVRAGVPDMQVGDVRVCVLADAELARTLDIKLRGWNIEADFVTNSALAVSSLVAAAV